MILCVKWLEKTETMEVVMKKILLTAFLAAGTFIGVQAGILDLFRIPPPPPPEKHHVQPSPPPEKAKPHHREIKPAHPAPHHQKNAVKPEPPKPGNIGGPKARPVPGKDVLPPRR